MATSTQQPVPLRDIPGRWPGETNLPQEILSGVLTTVERELLGQLTGDGFPLRVVAPRDEAHRAEVRQTAMSLLRQGLIEVYGRPEDASAVTQTEAEAVLSAPESWDPDGDTVSWFMCASPAGSALLLSDR